MTEISYKGANYIVLQTKQATAAIDPVVPGQKASKTLEKARVQLVTQPQFAKDPVEGQLVFSVPGEYEVADFSISSFDAVSQLNPEEKTVMYRVATPDCVIAILGHVNPDKITDEQLEGLGVVDILIIPVGGNGYTVDPHGAAQLTRRINPKIVIPVHYNEDKVAYDVSQLSVEQFVKEIGIPAQQEQTLKIKQPSQLPEVLTLVTLERTTA